MGVSWIVACTACEKKLELGKKSGTIIHNIQYRGAPLRPNTSIPLDRHPFALANYIWFSSKHDSVSVKLFSDVDETEESAEAWGYEEVGV